MAEGLRLGGKVRSLRRRLGLTQARMADRLQISASYLNLIEHDKRPLTAALLIKLAQTFDVDLATFSPDDDARLEADLMEVFGDRMFESHAVSNTEVREVVSRSPTVGRAVLDLYRSLTAERERSSMLAEKLVDDAELLGTDARMPSEEVTELVQRRQNHFPELEAAAERLCVDARVDPHNVWDGLVRALTELGVEVRVVEEGAFGGAVRFYDRDKRVLNLSEVLAPRSRHFHLAVQIGLLSQRELIDRIGQDPVLTIDESRSLLRVVLAGYFAGAVLMPYERFLSAAKATRYDIELLGHRFRTSFEQVCHRLATLRRPGAEGVRFHFIKIDTAGNISKRFSGSGIRFARFGGACPRWNVARAFMSPHSLRIQISRMPDGDDYFCVARVVRRRHGGYGATETVHAVGLGCVLSEAKHLVYADGFDLDRIEEKAVPIGVTCRLCERHDCDQRAFPSLQHPLQLDENYRGVGFYAALRQPD